MTPTEKRPLETGKVMVWSEKRGEIIEVDITPEHTPDEMKKNIGMSNDGGGGVHV